MFTDYTNKTIKSDVGKSVIILSRCEKSIKNTLWNFKCPYCNNLTTNSMAHIKRGDGCKNCRYTRTANSQKKTIQEFTNELLKIQPHISILGDYVNYHTKIKLLCKIHKAEFYGVPANILKSCNSCPTCIKETNLNNQQKYNLEYVLEWLKNNNFEIIDKNEYKNASSTITYKCLKCENIIRGNFSNLVSGRRCSYCSGFSQKTTEKFKKEVYNIVKEEYTVIGEYINGKNPILMKHNICLHKWFVSPVNFLYKERRCPKCQSSKGESEIANVLSELNFEYIREYKFENCKYKHLLRFDFYLPRFKAVIEFQGRQHYESVEFMGGEKDFAIRQKRDKIKYDFCKINDINFIEIKYDQYDIIKKLILEGLTLSPSFILNKEC